jgi:hypothetical protein
MTFTEFDYNILAAIVFRPDYPGYTPTVVEDPAGLAGAGMDTGKRYSHVSAQHMINMPDTPGSNPLMPFFARADRQAFDIAVSLGVPRSFLPDARYSALRVLEYPAGAASALHTDFDLFTINLWRSCPNPGLPATQVHMGELGDLLGLGPATPHEVRALSVVQRSLVYFAIPDHAAALPGGITVGKWLEERIARSRVQTGGRHG